jgi:hypothetical protein
VERKATKQSGYRPRESISETLEHTSGTLSTKPHHLILTEVLYMEFTVLFNCFNRLANYDTITMCIVYLKLLLHRNTCEGMRIKFLALLFSALDGSKWFVHDRVVSPLRKCLP